MRFVFLFNLPSIYAEYLLENLPPLIHVHGVKSQIKYQVSLRVISES